MNACDPELLRQYDPDRYVTDSHCHICFPQPIEESARNYEDLFSQLHIREAGLLSCPMSSHNDPEFDILENLKMLYLKDVLSIPVYACAGFTEYGDDPAVCTRLAEDMLKLGFDGFKSLEEHPKNRQVVGKGLPDPSYAAFFDILNDRKLPIVCHVGDPRCNWELSTATESAKALGRVYGEGFLPLDELYAEMETVIGRYPDIRFILAHFYFMTDNHDRLQALLEQHPNVYLDLTPGTEMYGGFSENPDLWKAFFLRWQDRILLGSDHYALGQGRPRYGLARSFLEGSLPFTFHGVSVRPFGLPEDVLQKIYKDNLHALYGAAPKPVDREAAYAYCCRFRAERAAELSDLGLANLDIITKHFA